MEKMKKQEHDRRCPADNAAVKRLKSLNPRLKNDFGVARIGVFGSYASGENREGSDIDLLVEFERPVNLFEFSHLKRYLSNQLGIEVDLVTPGALKPLIKNKILQSVAYI
jgi:uncharacterized protein